MYLMRECVRSLETSQEELKLVKLLNKLSFLITKFPKLLLIFFTESSPTDHKSLPTLPRTHTPSNSISTTNSSKMYSHSSNQNSKATHDFLLFTYLLKFIHREAQIGKESRQALLKIIHLAFNFIPPDSDSTNSTSTPINKLESITEESQLALIKFLIDSDFAQVLGAGLGALYGILPSKLSINNVTASPTSAANVEIVTGGMSLGGMGSTKGEDDLEAEQNRLKSLGISSSNETEFIESINIWLEVVEFTESVLALDLISLDIDSDLSKKRNELTNSILSSVYSLFLLNVLYPSVLESDALDNSSVAVLSYLNSLLEVVSEGSLLETCVMGFLMGEEIINANSMKVIKSGNNGSKLPSNTNLILIKSLNFNSFNRFTLKDLLLSTLNSHSSSTAISALTLLKTVLQQHDRWSLTLLDITLNQAATAFPVTLLESPLPPSGVAEEEEEEEFEYKSSQTDEEETFIYKSTLPATPRNSTHRLPKRTPKASKTPRMLLRTPNALGFGTPLAKTPSIRQHLSSMKSLLNLVKVIDPEYYATAAEGGEETGFENYLFDAEILIGNELGFKRGVKEEFSLEEKFEWSKGGKRVGLFGMKMKPSAKDLAKVKIGHRHYVESSGVMIGILLELFRNWFSNSVEMNLSLTEVFGQLAACPFRSLEGWLLPRTLAEGEKGVEKEEMEEVEGDDRSIDFDFDEAEQGEEEKISNEGGEDSLLFIINCLANSIKDYKIKVTKFDSFLIERRKGLMFVDNLTEALDNSTFLSNLLTNSTISNSFLSPTRVRTTSSHSNTSTIKNDGPASPFEDHYKQTQKMKINPIIILSPPPNKSSGQEFNTSPTKRLSKMPPPSPSSTGFSFSEVVEEEKVILPVSLSIILDNIIILEEFIKELGAIITVRKSLGIDPVRFI